MRIAVLGTGTVGRALAGALHELGHGVVVGTRNPAATMERSEPDQMGAPPFATWAVAHPGVPLATYAEAAAGAEVVVNASPGAAVLEVLGLAGSEHLAGKPLVDVSNALDFSGGFPPRLMVDDTDSLAERVQRAFPDARVVKTLNTMNALLMVDPARLPEPGTTFVSGDDPDAKAVVVGLLESLGHRDVLDLGGLETARGVELTMPLWLSLMRVLGGVDFQLRVVRRTAPGG